MSQNFDKGPSFCRFFLTGGSCPIAIVLHISNFCECCFVYNRFIALL